MKIAMCKRCKKVKIIFSYARGTCNACYNFLNWPGDYPDPKGD